MPLFLNKPKKHSESVKTQAKLPTFVGQVKKEKIVKVQLPVVEKPTFQTSTSISEATIEEVEKHEVVKLVEEMSSLFNFGLDTQDYIEKNAEGSGQLSLVGCFCKKRQNHHQLSNINVTKSPLQNSSEQKQARTHIYGAHQYQNNAKGIRGLLVFLKNTPEQVHIIIKKNPILIALLIVRCKQNKQAKLQ